MIDIGLLFDLRKIFFGGGLFIKDSLFLKRSEGNSSVSQENVGCGQLTVS